MGAAAWTEVSGHVLQGAGVLGFAATSSPKWRHRAADGRYRDTLSFWLQVNYLTTSQRSATRLLTNVSCSFVCFFPSLHSSKSICLCLRNVLLSVLGVANFNLRSPNHSTNQPKRLTKGGVRRRRETSSLARSKHSCVRNALLEMVNGALNWNWEFCLR
jgi:hypothetical protein